MMKVVHLEAVGDEGEVEDPRVKEIMRRHMRMMNEELRGLKTPDFDVTHRGLGDQLD
jgi:hypothetical protein